MTIRALPPLLMVAGSPVPCTRCQAPIPAAAFEYPYWTKTHHSLLAWCPRCGVRVTVATKAWRRASGLHEPLSA